MFDFPDLKDSRIARVSAYVLINAKKVVDREYAKSEKGGLRLKQILEENKDVVGPTKLVSIMTSLEANDIVCRDGDGSYCILKSHMTTLLQKKLREKELI